MRIVVSKRYQLCRLQ